MRLALLGLTGCATTADASSEAPGFAGTTIHSPTSAPKAAVVVLHGSDGGRAPYAPYLADHLARQGFVAAAFCWFGCDGLPARIERIPLERTVEFLRWFRSGPAKDLPVVLYGASRGAEHALLLASLLGDTTLFDAVASHAGTDTVVAGYDPATGGPITAAGGWAAAWTWEGAPLYGERAKPYGSGPRIAVERYPGPLWLSHGELDALWPVQRSRTLAAARGALPTETHFRPGEGHIPANVQAFFASLVAFVDATPRSAIVPDVAPDGARPGK